MLIHVRLLHCAIKKFTYSVPSKLQNKISKGVLVQVPLQSKFVPAVVEEIAKPGQSYRFAIKAIHDIYQFPQDACYKKFITKISQYYQTDQLHFFRRVQNFLQEKEKPIKALPIVEVEQDIVRHILTDEQQIAYEAIAQSLGQKEQKPHVLHGVTGSGKTEIYKKLIQDVVAQGQTAILMLPEVTLALQFEKLLAQYFTDVPVIGFHSATTVTTKRRLWKNLVEKQPIIIVGVHLPVLLPIANLGLIVVDEEHDAGYQEKKHPKVHSRDMAVLKASMANATIVLGSATPSLQTLYNVDKRGWSLLHLRQRFAGKFPQIKIVSLQSKKKRDCFWITDQLQHEMQDRLNKKEQTIIFLNRRGYSFFVQCQCSYVFSCQQCSVSLTLHDDHSMRCHYCGHAEMLPNKCPDCNTSNHDFLKKGVGTQQVVASLQKLFPQAVIARADADTTSKKRTWQQTVKEMMHGEIDILVGTQSITKGYHFPGVTLVGVLWADLGLHFPMYNAAETTLQQLIQVAGRAGRQSEESKVLVQTFDDHPIYQFINEQDYMNFYHYEIEKRDMVGYPPCKHIADIEIRHKEQKVVEQDAQSIAQQLQNQLSDDVELFGPVSSIVYRVKGVFVQKIILKSLDRAKMIQLFNHLEKNDIKSSLFFMIDPV